MFLFFWGSVKGFNAPARATSNYAAARTLLSLLFQLHFKRYVYTERLPKSRRSALEAPTAKAYSPGG